MYGFFPVQVTDIMWPAETDHIAGQWFRSFFKPSNLDLSRPGFNRSFQRFAGVGGPKWVGRRVWVDQWQTAVAAPALQFNV